MTTRRAYPTVSAVSAFARTIALGLALGLVACAGRPRPTTQVTNQGGFESTDNSVVSDSRMTTIQFENAATVHVDVYITTDQFQWRLGRVPPGMQAMLRVPQSAIESTVGFVQLIVIPGAQVSAQAARDPRAVLAIVQPMSAVLSQRWTFRQPAGAALQLEGMRVAGERPW